MQETELFTIEEHVRDAPTLRYSGKNLGGLLGMIFGVTPDSRAPVFSPEYEPISTEVVEAVLLTLTPHEERVLKMRFGLNASQKKHTQAEAAYLLTTSILRIRQIETKALRKLRHHSQADRLKVLLIPIESDPDDMWDCLHQSLATLQYRDAELILRYYSAEGASRTAIHAEMAREFEISLSALRARAFRIRKHLAREMERCSKTSPQGESSNRRAAVVPVIQTFHKLEPDLISHLKRQSDDLVNINPLLFEHLFAEFLAARGFDDVRLVGRNTKTSADIFAAKFVPGPDIPMRVFVEVKRWKNTIGIEVINQVLGAFLGERERFGWNAALVVTVGGFREFEKWSREELALKGLYLKDRDDLLRYLDGYKQHANGLWLPNPRTDL
jgi:HJR/Mrr/RecB family endonuclease